MLFKTLHHPFVSIGKRQLFWPFYHSNVSNAVKIVRPKLMFKSWLTKRWKKINEKILKHHPHCIFFYCKLLKRTMVDRFTSQQQTSSFSLISSSKLIAVSNLALSQWLKFWFEKINQFGFRVEIFELKLKWKIMWNIANIIWMGFDVSILYKATKLLTRG